MNARETYNAIQSGNQKDAQRALFQLLGMVQELSSGILEMVYCIEKATGQDSLGQRPRQWLREFLELPRGKEKLT